MCRMKSIAWTLPGLLVILILLSGCAGTIEKMTAYTDKLSKRGQPVLPDPIAGSIREMPPEAGAVTAAAGHWMLTGRGASGVVFDAGGSPQASRFSWLKQEGFVRTGAALYRTGRNPDHRQQQLTDGRLDFQDPFGRKASFRFVAAYRSGGGRRLVENMTVTPIYSYAPEPVMFVVPLGKLPRDATGLPNSYGALFDYIGKRAVESSKPADHVLEENDYAIFVFSTERISPSALFEVKISNTIQGVYGYKDASRYVDFNGWRVGILAGRCYLFDDTGQNRLYVKTVFTPGEEVGRIRPPVLVGLYCLNGSGADIRPAGSLAP